MSARETYPIIALIFAPIMYVARYVLTVLTLLLVLPFACCDHISDSLPDPPKAFGDFVLSSVHLTVGKMYGYDDKVPNILIGLLLLLFSPVMFVLTYAVSLFHPIKAHIKFPEGFNKLVDNSVAIMKEITGYELK